MGAKEGGRELFDDPSYVNVDKPRPPVAANGNAHRDAFDMSTFFFITGSMQYFYLTVEK